MPAVGASGASVGARNQGHADAVLPTSVPRSCIWEGRIAGTTKISMNLPTETVATLHQIRQTSGRSMTEIVRIGIGLYQMAQSQQLRVLDETGQPTQRILLF